MKFSDKLTTKFFVNIVATLIGGYVVDLSKDIPPSDLYESVRFAIIFFGMCCFDLMKFLEAQK